MRYFNVLFTGVFTNYLTENLTQLAGETFSSAEYIKKYGTEDRDIFSTHTTIFLLISPSYIVII